MKILVINCGSSSFKFCLFEMNTGKPIPLASGLFDEIGGKVPSYSRAAELSLQSLVDPKTGVLSSIDEIHAVGHRVVHGGETFIEPAVIDDKVMDAIEDHCALAPLHNPINLEGIRALQSLLPDIPHVAVFDTAFHQSLAPEAFLYAIPYEYYEKYGIRRYGFHGSSHKYVYHEAVRFLNQNPQKFKAIVCHLGSGASITAVCGGKVMETSMGFTPLEGLIMGTRTGDLDPSIPFFLAKKTGSSLEKIEQILNKESGMMGISGYSHDMQAVLKMADKNDMQCQVAVNAYVHRVIKYIGAYFSVLNGADAIIFTAGVGEHSPKIRRLIMERLSWLGIGINKPANALAIRKKAVISKEGSKVSVLVIPTDEAREIAQETYEKMSQMSRQ